MQSVGNIFDGFSGLEHIDEKLNRVTKMSNKSSYEAELANEISTGESRDDMAIDESEPIQK